SSNPRKKHRED
nr:Chain B, DNA mismatch repair protein Mlh1 [Homo sapiens]